MAASHVTIASLSNIHMASRVHSISLLHIVYKSHIHDIIYQYLLVHCVM